MQTKPVLIKHYFPEYEKDVNDYLKWINGKYSPSEDELNKLKGNINTLSYKTGILTIKDIIKNLRIDLNYNSDVSIEDMIKIAVWYHDGTTNIVNCNYLEHSESSDYLYKVLSTVKYDLEMFGNIKAKYNVSKGAFLASL